MKYKLVQEALQAYGLDAVSFTELASGYANVNYKVWTSTGPVLLRLCRQQPLELLAYEALLMQQLRQLGFPTAYPIPRRDGAYVTQVGEENIMLYDFVQGQEPEVNPATAAEIGEAVGKLSTLQAGPELQKKNAVHILHCQRLITEFSQAANQYPDIFSYFEEQTAYLEPLLSRPLPTGVIHGDVFPNNTLFSGNKLLAIIDFEEACTDHLLMDVGMSMNGFCFVDNRLDMELAESFLAAYTCQRPLQEEEWALLPVYLQWGAHGMLSWHLRNNLLYHEKPHQLVRVRELMERTIRLRHTEDRILKDMTTLAKQQTWK
ncbi:homoserine kinase [Pontibacter litorisediminis]|uniref:homoserine kinase n=1 Tax=Pontibacter litorisediminis TaxID=1846260 RepID=UPI0023EAF13E|nr:homoserine kinase [Pontibacter litorisediminis]